MVNVRVTAADHNGNSGDDAARLKPANRLHRELGQLCCIGLGPVW